MHRFAGGLIASASGGLSPPGLRSGRRGCWRWRPRPRARRSRRRATPEQPARRRGARPRSAAFRPASRARAGRQLPPTGNTVGTGDATAASCRSRVDGTSYLVLSTGDATQADQADRPGASPASTTSGPRAREAQRGSRRDAASISFNSRRRRPRHGLLRFDFRFLSEEYPARLGSPFTDTFVAEVDSATAWSAVGRRRSRRRTTSPRSPAASR